VNEQASRNVAYINKERQPRVDVNSPVSNTLSSAVFLDNKPTFKAVEIDLQTDTELIKQNLKKIVKENKQRRESATQPMQTGKSFEKAIRAVYPES